MNNLGVAQGAVKINTSDLKNADLALRSAGRGLAGFGLAAVAAFGYVVNQAAKFEVEMDFVQAVTNSTGEEMDELRDKAIELGTEGIFGPIELSKAFVDLAKAGASTRDIIDGVGEASVNLATAADVPIQQAGEDLINILNTFKLGAGDAVRVADLLAGAANASSVELADLVYSLRYAGPVAQGLGIDIESVNDALTILGKVGIRGSTAGTSLRQIMLNLSPSTKKASDRMKELGIITEDGTNLLFTAAGEAKTLAEVFEILGEKTKDLNSQQKTDALRDLFGIRAIPSALELLSQGADGFREIRDEINRTTAADVAAKRIDNLSGSIKLLKATLQALFIDAGGPFQEMLKGWVDNLRELLLWFNDLPGPIKTFIVGAVGIIGVVSILAGIFLLTIGNIVRTIRVLAELKNAFGLFNAAFLLNPWTLLALAIVAVIAALVLLYFKFEPFRKFIDGLWQSIQEFWDKVLEKGRQWKENIENFFKGFGNIGSAFKDAFSNQGITTGADNIIGVAERVGNALGDAWRAVGRYAQSVGNFFVVAGRLIGGSFLAAVEAAVGFVKSIPGTIERGIQSALGFLANMATEVANSVLGVVDAIEDFAQSIPGILGRGFKRASLIVIDWARKLPGWIANGFGFALGRLIRWNVLFVKNLYTAFFNATKAAITWGIEFTNAIGTWLSKTIEKVVLFGLGLIVETAKAFGGMLVEAARWLQQLPFEVIKVIAAVGSQLGQWASEAYNQAKLIGLNILNGIIDYVATIAGRCWTELTNMIATIIGFIPVVWDAAWQIGTTVYDTITGFFTDLPGMVTDWLQKAVDVVWNFAKDFFAGAKNLGQKLWGGFRDGLFGSPHTKIEYAMWDMEENMKESLKTLKSNMRTLSSFGQGLPPIQMGMLGVSSPSTGAASSQASQVVYNNNAPLIGTATIRDERDIVELSRLLAYEQAKQMRGRGAR